MPSINFLFNREGQEGEQLGIPDFSSTEIFKRYEYESPNRIYALQLTLSSDRSPQHAESIYHVLKGLHQY
jgi:hypothetical protein